jgi:hypothetical protein
VTSLENEIMRLQEVLKEREAEISVLEGSLKQSQKDHVAVPTPISGQVDVEAVKENGNVPTVNHLSPKTMSRFEHIRKSMENGYDHDPADSEKNGSSVSETDESSLDRLNELML